ncbi:MAG: cation:proton antiporter, partial [Spirochaetota bacterium]
MDTFIDILLQIRDIFRYHLLFSLGILLISGYIFGKLAEKVKLPSITGYILAGLVLGPSVLGLVPHIYEIESLAEDEVIEKKAFIEEEGEKGEEDAEHKETEEDKEKKEEDTKGHGKGNPLGNVTEFALGLIAITIGGEFSLHKLKKTGKAVVIMTIGQLFLSFTLVSLFLWIFQFDLVFSLILGAIASATAPAATVAIIQSLNAKGPFVDYLYGIVALDDAGAVILFGVIFSIASSILAPATGEAVSAFSIVLSSFMEVVFSILMGLILGFILHYLIQKGRQKNITINEQLIISLSILFLSTAMAKSLHLSPLLTNMVLGGVLINLSERNEAIFKVLGPLTPPIYAAFFAIAGTELNIMVFTDPLILMYG